MELRFVCHNNRPLITVFRLAVDRGELEQNLEVLYFTFGQRRKFFSLISSHNASVMSFKFFQQTLLGTVVLST